MNPRHGRFLENLFELEGRAVLIAGAGTVGTALAMGLGQAGARVAMCDMSEARLKVASTQMSTLGVRYATHCLNLSEPKNCAALVERVVHDFGDIEVLVTATTLNERMPFLDVTSESYGAVTAATLKAPFFVSQAVAKRMALVGRGGCIIHMSSVNAAIPATHNAVYAMCKAAINSLVRSQARELAPIRVVGVELGFVESDLTREIRADHRNASVLAHTPLGRMAEPREVVGPIIALASNAGSFMTGAIIPLHGGYPLWDWMAQG